MDTVGAVRSRRWGWALLTVAAVTALAAAVLFVRGREQAEPSPPQLEQAVARAEAGTIATASGAWQPLAALPLPRTEQPAVWTGRELVVWGGALDDGFTRRTFQADGAALDPATGVWRPLPQAPLAPRTDHLTAWTGTELIVWGGTGDAGLLNDGAAYNPTTDRWRALPPGPLSPRAEAAGVWTGSTLLVLGGADNGGPLTDAAAYDPDGGWRPIAALPPEFAAGVEVDTRAAAVGAGAVAWTADRGGRGLTAAARYDLAADAWSPLPDPLGAVASGLPLLIPDGDRLQGLRIAEDGVSTELIILDPGAADWRATPTPPLDGDPWSAIGVLTDAGLLVTDGLSGLVNSDGSWLALGDAPPSGPGERSVIWTGRDLLVTGDPPRGDSGATGATGTAVWTPS